MCVELSLTFPPDLLRTDLGAADSRPRQRLHSFFDRILRGHQHLRSAHLSLRAPLIPPNVDGAQAIQIVCPSPGEGRDWVTDLMGTNCCNHET